MKNSRFLNKEEIEKFLKTHPKKEALITKLDRSVTYWRNNVRRSA